MASRAVCILGGTGFVGSRLCARLARSGHRLTVATRDPNRARHLSMLPDLRLQAADVHDPVQLAALFAGQDTVINLVGILNERGRDGSGFRRAHTELARKLLVACRAARVPRLLQMSGLNADPERGASHYLRSKGLAERLIRDEAPPDLVWTIFQPSVIFGTGDGFVCRFAALLKLLPALPLARPRARFAPVWVEDVTGAMELALADPATSGETYQLCGPEVYSLREAVCSVRDALGLRRAVIGLPDWTARMQAAVMDFVPGKPFSTDNYRSLGVHSVCRSDGFARLGLRPQPLSALLPQVLGLDGEASQRLRWRQRGGR